MEINEDNIFQFKTNDEMLDIKDKILESGKKLSEIMLPVMAQLHFDTFQNFLLKNEYSNVYTSKIYETIIDLCNDTNIFTVNIGTKVLRARIIKDSNDIYGSKNGIHIDNDVLRGYDWYNSKEPAIGISSEGRANSQFSSYFYCSTDAPTAASEIKANIGDYISLASFIIKRNLKLIRFEIKDSGEEKTLEACYKNIIANKFSVPIRNSKEYRLTQFISDEIRKHGLDGICYKSHFTHDDNYVIFNCSMSTLEFINSKIIQLHSQQLNYIDFSSNKILRTKPIPDWDTIEIKTEKSRIINIMKSYQDELILDNNHTE